MKSISLLLLIILYFPATRAQTRYLDSMKHRLDLIKKDDTIKVGLLNELAWAYLFKKPDSAVSYARKSITLSNKLNYKYGEALGFSRLSSALLNATGNYPKALEAALHAAKISEKLKYGKEDLMFSINMNMGDCYSYMGNDKKASIFYHLCLNLQRYQQLSPIQRIRVYGQLAYLYVNLSQLDSALYYAEKNYQYGLALKNNRYVQYTFGVMGVIYEKLGKNELAEKYTREGIKIAVNNDDENYQIQGYRDLANLFNSKGRRDSSIFYAQKSLRLSQKFGYPLYILAASTTLTHLYELQNRPDSILKYVRMMLTAKDSIFSQQKFQEFQLLSFEEEQRQRDVETAKAQLRNQVSISVLIAASVFFLLVALILYRNNKQKKKSNFLLQQQKEKAEQALVELKLTQAQLVQSEKMASLGELTAGIAHEIQNPLNFVNNFSEVNKELIEEMQSELKSGNNHEAIAISNDIKENEQKINHHGKRADAIVKGMLQHSRSSSGVKEPTDINALADEYLRLAYHGLRAKDKSFNATMKTDFDSTIGNINIISQDMGRVILNLITNAFYAVTEKKKLQSVGYEPIVSVSTKRVTLPAGDWGVEISVKDNGMGISQKVLDKIYQPFFTTKPAGQGTGLGLSMSYDIITKGHGGELKVETKEGEYATFIIILPMQTESTI